MSNGNTVVNLLGVSEIIVLAVQMPSLIYYIANS